MHIFHCIFLADLFLIALFPEAIPFLEVILRLRILVVSLLQRPPWPSGLHLKIVRESKKQR